MGSSVGKAIVVFVLWFTLGLGNVIYALVAHYTAEKVMVRVESPEGRFSPAANGFSRPRKMELNWPATTRGVLPTGALSQRRGDVGLRGRSVIAPSSGSPVYAR